MVLASIGIVFFLANILQLADMTIAMIFAVTILFLQSPLIDTIGAFPLLLEAQVRFDVAVMKQRDLLFLNGGELEGVNKS